jgi:hypothetical protein
LQDSILLAGKVRQSMPVQDALQFATGWYAGSTLTFTGVRILADAELACEKRRLVP